MLESQLQAMVDGVVPADPGELERARAAAAGLSRMIAQLGELTQAEAAPLQRRAELVDIAAVARDAADGLAAVLRERNVSIQVEGAGPTTAVVDRGQLTRALRNLLTNAVNLPRRDGDRFRCAAASGRRYASGTRGQGSPTRTGRTSSSASTAPIGPEAAPGAASA